MKKLIALLGGVALVAMSLLTAFGFSDVTQDDFYFDAVSYLEDESLVTGYGDGTFGYSSEINRAELITLVVRAKFVLEQGVGVEIELDPADCGGDIFTDVEEDNWYAGSVCYAKLSGWIEGYDDGSFDPTRDVNFVEVLKIAMIAFGIDYDKETTPWYKGLVEAASAKNLIPLTIDSFGKKVSRGEMADLIARVLKYNEGDLDEFLCDKADYVVTFETIEDGEDMSVIWDMPDQTEGEGEGGQYNLPSDLLWDDFNAYFVVGADGQVPTGYKKIENTGMLGDEIDLMSSTPFQSIFVGGIFLTSETGIGVENEDGDILYFAVSASFQDGSRDNYIMKYDQAVDETDILFQYLNAEGDKLYLWGIDPVNNYAIFSVEVADFQMPGCSSAWLDLDLKYIEIDSGDADLIPYDVPEWKTEAVLESLLGCD